MPMKAPAIAPLEWVALVGAFAVGVASCLSPETIADGPIFCPFRLLTGVPCPACGLTRSWVFALHAQWMDAATANAFGLPLLVATLMAALVALASRAGDRAPPRLEVLARHYAAVALFALWGAYGGLRMVIGP